VPVKSIWIDWPPLPLAEVSAVIEVLKADGLELRVLIDTVAAGLCSSRRVVDAPSRRTYTVLGPLWTSHRSLFCLDGAGYRVVSGAHYEPGVNWGLKRVLANKSIPRRRLDPDG
jgi:hypothetical protein